MSRRQLSKSLDVTHLASGFGLTLNPGGTEGRVLGTAVLPCAGTVQPDSARRVEDVCIGPDHKLDHGLYGPGRRPLLTGVGWDCVGEAEDWALL